MLPLSKDYERVILLLVPHPMLLIQHIAFLKASPEWCLTKVFVFLLTYWVFSSLVLFATKFIFKQPRVYISPTWICTMKNATVSIYFLPPDLSLAVGVLQVLWPKSILFLSTILPADLSMLEGQSLGCVYDSLVGRTWHVLYLRFRLFIQNEAYLQQLGFSPWLLSSLLHAGDSNCC